LLEQIEAERLDIYNRSLKLKERAETDDEKEKARLAAMLSVKQRLMRRLEMQTVTHTLEDDLGASIHIVTRFMSQVEINRAKDLEQLTNDKSGEGYFKAMDGLKALLDDITVGPPELTGGFWSSPECPADPAVIVGLVLRTMRKTITAIGAARSFRDLD